MLSVVMPNVSVLALSVSTLFCSTPEQSLPAYGVATATSIAVFAFSLLVFQKRPKLHEGICM